MTFPLGAYKEGGGSNAMHHDYRVLMQILREAQKAKAPMNGAFWGLFCDQPLFH